eukprot:scaffold819_cov350-Prasinococcus_capsulatus_cf.AAC.15
MHTSSNTSEPATTFTCRRPARSISEFQNTAASSSTATGPNWRTSSAARRLSPPCSPGWRTLATALVRMTRKLSLRDATQEKKRRAPGQRRQ